MEPKSHRPIMDCGPALNFFSINKERLLFSVLPSVCIPETVHGEIIRKSHSDARFKSAARVLAKLSERLLTTLPDDAEANRALDDAVQRMTGMPFAERRRRSKDLGEIMVIAHAVAVAESGSNVLILLDETDGTSIAKQQIRRLNLIRPQHPKIGRVQIVSTASILEAAIGGEHIPTKGDMKSLYKRLRKLDDGLVPIENTTLLTSKRWSSG